MASKYSFLRESKKGVLIDLHVQPRASRNCIAGLYGDRLKVSVKAPPVDSKANEACRTLLAKALKIPKARIILKAGQTSRHKTFLIDNGAIKKILPRLDGLVKSLKK